MQERKKERKDEGFTLIEMLIIVVIIGILAAALIPKLQSLQSRTRDTIRIKDITNIGNMIETYKTDGHNPLWVPSYASGARSNTEGGWRGRWDLSSNDNAPGFLYRLIEAGIATSIPKDPLDSEIPFNKDPGSMEGKTIYSYVYFNATPGYKYSTPGDPYVGPQNPPGKYMITATRFETSTPRKSDKYCPYFWESGWLKFLSGSVGVYDWGICGTY